MNSTKMFSHARAALCLALALTFLSATTIPQENEPKVLKKVLPVYPDILKKMGVSGTVRVRITIGADGSVKDVEARGGNAIFIDSVAAAVRNWKFVSGERQRSAEVTVTFTCCTTVTTIP